MYLNVGQGEGVPLGVGRPDQVLEVVDPGGGVPDHDEVDVAVAEVGGGGDAARGVAAPAGQARLTNKTFKYSSATFFQSPPHPGDH